ncbi:ABL040Wp [Eremothecium gossypii ATCC 10895]|uniref:ABL040Wp n=1 Tax=Eremothecium gossypii (strain ATCC 10895 / CBS 109.51 / FGSC 9923 / NRRL Y-1056) TaxID=284811 RepID=Q75DQ7_EREGS|nr:ABL040Wp [Eremothecium gossypii ATCC 10895]AAS50731.1 ABL040Wp [Eremothecium gossypii ATCC 10895]
MDESESQLRGTLLPHDSLEYGTNSDKTLTETQRCQEHNRSLPKAPILTSLWLGSFLASIDASIVANIMNKIAEEFHESDKKQWMATSFLLTNAAFQPLYGRCSDIVGRKCALLIAQSFFLLGTLLTCFARNVTEFAIARAICGMGGGGIGAMSSITVSDICTTKERGMYQGYANVIFGAGQVLGAPVGGLIMETFNWRIIFAAQVVAIMICMILAYRNINLKLLHIPPFHQRFTRKNLSRIDLFGSSMLSCSLVSFLMLFSSGVSRSLWFLLTLVSLTLFCINERYIATERLLPNGILRGHFGLSALLIVVSSFMMFAELYRMPVYLQLIQDISVSRSGIFLLFASVSSSGASLFTGWLLRTTKQDLGKLVYKIALASSFIQLVGMMLALFTTSVTEPSQAVHAGWAVFSPRSAGQMHYFKSDSIAWRVLLTVALMCSSFAYASLLVSILVSIVDTTEKSQQATMIGVFYLWRSIGNTLGASVPLSVYEFEVARKLWDYMEAQGLRDTYLDLLHDSSILRQRFRNHTLAALLQIYRSCFQVSYLPSICVCILGILAATRLTQRAAHK